MEAKQLNFLLTFWCLVLRTPPTNIGNFTLSAQKRRTVAAYKHSAQWLEVADNFKHTFRTKYEQWWFCKHRWWNTRFSQLFYFRENTNIITDMIIFYHSFVTRDSSPLSPPDLICFTMICIVHKHTHHLYHNNVSSPHIVLDIVSLPSWYCYWLGVSFCTWQSNMKVSGDTTDTGDTGDTHRDMSGGDLCGAHHGQHHTTVTTWWLVIHHTNTHPPHDATIWATPLQDILYPTMQPVPMLHRPEYIN